LRAIASGQLLEDHRRLDPVTPTEAGALRGRRRDRVQSVPLRRLPVELALEFGEVSRTCAEELATQ
jgi:hypothetical protein